MEGYFGIKTVAENGVGVVVDEFAYNVYSYIDRKNDDVKTNFNDTTTKIMFNEEVPDFYLPSKYWHLGTGVKLPLYTSKTKDDGYLKFSNASEFSCFGGKTRYTDFIVRYDVKITDDIQSGNLIGIQFAKKQLSESSTNSTFIAFQCINLNGNYTTCYLSNKCVSTRGDNNGIIENLDNIFVADKVHYTYDDATKTATFDGDLQARTATFQNLKTTRNFEANNMQIRGATLLDFINANNNNITNINIAQLKYMQMMDGGFIRHFYLDHDANYYLPTAFNGFMLIYCQDDKGNLQDFTIQGSKSLTTQHVLLFKADGASIGFVQRSALQGYLSTITKIQYAKPTTGNRLLLFIATLDHRNDGIN